MPTEAELRRRLRGDGDTPIDTPPVDTPPIDTATVIRRSRRRRLPRRIALGATVTLAVVGIGVAGISGIQGLGGMAASDSAGGGAESAADESAADESAADESAGGGAPDVLRAPAIGPDGCGTTVETSDTDTTDTDTDTDPTDADPTGLEVRTDFPDTVPGDGSTVTGSVTVTNTTGVRITGTTALPSIAVLDSGTVVGYDGEPTPTLAAALDLAPGETTRFDSSVAAVGCGDGTDGADSGGRAVLESGSYELTAVIEFTPDVVGAASPATESVILTAPGEPITIG